ncbi:hypothetical protein BDW62DRAFT_218201 [Aspergillus aurantiobrunneus]
MKVQIAAGVLVGAAVAIPGSIPCSCVEKTVTVTVTESCLASSPSATSTLAPAMSSSSSAFTSVETNAPSSSSSIPYAHPSTAVSSSSKASTTTTSSSATPSSSGASEACTNNDADMWTRDNYSENDVSEWYNDWYTDNISGDDQIDETFAAYWGLGPSYSCDILNQCDPPQCSALKRPDQAYDYDKAAMFLASMSNFNAHYSKIYQALDGAKIDFGAIEATLQQTFSPGLSKADMAKIQGLSGGQVGIGVASAWSGPASPLVNTIKELYGGVARGISALLRASDKSVQNMASLEENFTGKMDKIRKVFAEIHDDVLKWGVHNYTTIDSIFDGGAYVDDREIAILHDISTEDLRDYIREQMFATIINDAWLKQGAYILGRPMDEEDCKEYTVTNFEDMPDHLCYDNHIYWLYQYRGATEAGTSGVDPMPGSKEDLEKHVGITTQDAMRSAIEAYNDGGYKYDSAADVDHLFEGDIQEKIDMKSRLKGFWFFPICEVESSEEFDQTGLQQEKYGPTSLYWSEIDHNYPANNKGSDGIQMCLCATAKDRHGVSIKELESPGDGSFRAVLDAPEHQSCNIKKKLTFD